MLERIFASSGKKVFEKSKAAVTNCGWSIANEDASLGLIECKTSASFFSWGETIQIKIEDLRVNETKVSINSEVNSQLISWGKDSQNELQFMSVLTELLAG